MTLAEPDRKLCCVPEKNNASCEVDAVQYGENGEMRMLINHNWAAGNNPQNPEQGQSLS